MIDQAAYLAVETVNAARRWVAARIALKRALDSKAATPQQVDKAKQAYNRTAEELESFVLRLERFMQTNGKKVSRVRKGSGPFPWRELFGMVAAGAKAVENALEAPPTQAKVVNQKIIDVDAE